VKLRSDLIKALAAGLQEQLSDLEGIYLFGSRVNGRSNKKSDWDFAYLSRMGLKAEQQWEIKTGLETKYDLDLDLADLYKASTVFQIQVINKGKLVWIGDESKVREFEYLTYSAYQKLNEERADIIKDIEERGSIYG